ncbi:hypothetical protein I4F81_004625 [Pyropia yezoensis]|uniref:Uncharacterized protein n=1 Tax=Pyropia yezoensis TaxID=2788 RepID=A0ACC3BVT8_PYRYE|nr:hypothetical protein I4F81_004625 [Neopyropia yezoensis]
MLAPLAPPHEVVASQSVSHRVPSAPRSLDTSDRPRAAGPYAPSPPFRAALTRTLTSSAVSSTTPHPPLPHEAEVASGLWRKRRLLGHRNIPRKGGDQLIKRSVEVVIHNLGVKQARLLGRRHLRLGHHQPGRDGVLRLGAAAAEAAAELLHRRGRHKHKQRRDARCTHQPAALHVNIQDADAARRAHPLHRLKRGAVVAAVDVGVLQKGARRNTSLEVRLGREVVVRAVHLPRPGGPRRVADGKAKDGGVGGLQAGDERALADARGAGKDHCAGADHGGEK